MFQLSESTLIEFQFVLGKSTVVALENSDREATVLTKPFVEIGSDYI